MTFYRLVKRDGKFLIKRGFVWCTYLDMKTPNEFFWWYTPSWVLEYCLADSEEHALSQLKKYKEYILAKKNPLKI